MSNPYETNHSDDYTQEPNSFIKIWEEYRQHPIFQKVSETEIEKKAQDIANRITESINARTNRFFKS